MKQNDKNLSLERKILRASHISDVGCGIVLLLYTVFILNLNFTTHYPLILVVLFGILFAQFGISPITNHMLFCRVSKKVEKWENEEMSMEDRTKLFLSLHKLPRRKCIEATTYFVICAIGLAGAYHFIYNVNISINAVSLFSCVLGAYIAGLLALSHTRAICNDIACQLVDQGIDEKILKNKNKKFMMN